MICCFFISGALQPSGYRARGNRATVAGNRQQRDLHLPLNRVERRPPRICPDRVRADQHRVCDARQDLCLVDRTTRTTAAAATTTPAVHSATPAAAAASCPTDRRRRSNSANRYRAETRKNNRPVGPSRGGPSAAADHLRDQSVPVQGPRPGHRAGKIVQSPHQS